MPWVVGKMNLKGNESIKEILVSGAKSYSYIKCDPDTDKSEYIIKQEGITLDDANSNMFNYEDIRNMVLENKILKSTCSVGIVILKIFRPSI